MSWLAHPYRILLVLLVFHAAAVLAADDDQERFQRAIEHLRANEIEAGRAVLNMLLASQPDNPLYLFNLANVDYLEGKYAAAITLYTRLQALPSPLRLPAGLYLSNCYLQLGQLNEAFLTLLAIDQQQLTPNLALDYADKMQNLGQKSLAEAVLLIESGAFLPSLGLLSIAEQALDDGRIKSLRQAVVQRLEDRDQSERLPIERYIEFRASGEEPKMIQQFRAQLAIDAGYHSNIYAAAGADAQASLIFNTLLDGSYQLGSLAAFKLASFVTVNLSEAALDSSYQYLEAATGLSLSRDIGEFFYVSLSPEFSRQWLASRGTVDKVAAGLRLELRPGGSYNLGVRYRSALLLPIDSNFGYLSGTTQSLEFYLSMGYDQILLIPYLVWEHESNQDLIESTYLLPLSYQSLGGGLIVANNFAKDWKLSGDVYYVWRSYLRQALPDATSRKDQQLNLGLKLSWSISTRFSVYNKLSGRLNVSSLDASSQVGNRNYTQGIALLGFEWEI